MSCAFLQSQCKEKIYTIAGPEFGPKLQGKVLVMNKSIYRLCSASASFHEHCARVLHNIGFKPSHDDPDLWMKDCKTHYKYVVTWVDDVLVMSKEPLKVIQDFKEAEEYELKGVGTPKYYLGGAYNNARLTTTLATKHMPRPTLLPSPTRSRNSWNGHSGVTCHRKTQTTLRILTKHHYWDQNNIRNTG